MFLKKINLLTALWSVFNARIHLYRFFLKRPSQRFSWKTCLRKGGNVFKLRAKLGIEKLRIFFHWFFSLRFFWRFTWSFITWIIPNRFTEHFIELRNKGNSASQFNSIWFNLKFINLHVSLNSSSTETLNFKYFIEFNSGSKIFYILFLLRKDLQSGGEDRGFFSLISFSTFFSHWLKSSFRSRLWNYVKYGEKNENVK